MSKTDKIFLLIPFAIFVSLLFSWNLQNYITPDSLIYFSIAEDFPKINNSIFPILYPFLLRIFNILFNDYMISYKIINIFCIIFSFYFTLTRNFFWKQIWFILAFASFLQIFLYAWSENLIIPILIVFFYINYLYLNNLTIKANKYVFLNSICLILLFLTKYNSIFFLIPQAFMILYYIKLSNKKYKPILLSLIIVTFTFGLYLFLNLELTQSFTGKRGMLNEMSYIRYLKLSLFNLPTTVDPISLSLIKILYLKPHTFFWKIPYLFSFIFLSYLLYLNVKNGKCTPFTILCFSSSMVFLIGSLISAYFTRIDVLGARLALGFYLPLFIGIIQNIKSLEISKANLILLSLTSILIHLTSNFYNGFT